MFVIEVESYNTYYIFNKKNIIVTQINIDGCFTSARIPAATIFYQRINIDSACIVKTLLTFVLLFD